MTDRSGVLDGAAMGAALEQLNQLTMPPGSLGRIGELLVWLAGVRGEPRPTFEQRSIVVFAGDHGVTAQGVSAWPSAVTAQMVANFMSGGAAISSLARTAGAELVVVDVGVAHEVPADSTLPKGDARLVRARVADGTRDFSVERGMTDEHVHAAMSVGRLIIEELAASGTTICALGEMGIGNTTAASAIVAALTGHDANAITGHGAGLDDGGRLHKVAVIERALDLHRLRPDDPMGVLASVGGLEISALVGAIHAAAEQRIPVILDGFITGAAALVAVALHPECREMLVASHRSAERGHALALEHLGLRPLLDLDLRLGEASGAALALILTNAAVRLRDEMATFGSASVSRRHI